MSEVEREPRTANEAAEALRNERNFLQSLLEHERGNFAAVESDRIARGEVIEKQGAEMARLHARIDDQLKELTRLYEERERSRWEGAVLAGILECVLGGATRAVAPGAQGTLLDAMREYNHHIVDELARITPIAGRRVLDIGASPHGYALEWALRHRVAEYLGIGLDMPYEAQWDVAGHRAILRRMNAESLDLPDASYDAAVSISTFEHIADLRRALAECHRVLRPGGKCLVVFEPIWTSAGGHHLHHFGDVASLVPDWSHLVWTPDEMRRQLASRWPVGSPLGLEEAVHWIYEGRELNRVGIRELERILASSPFTVERSIPMREKPRQPAQLEAAMAATGLSRTELSTRGFSIVLAR